jgi:transcription elongation factor SPT6
MEPGEAAEEHLSSMFPSTETVLEGTRHMVAMQIARDPLVRQCIRQIFSERAKVTITPTKKGKKVSKITSRSKTMFNFLGNLN